MKSFLVCIVFIVKLMTGVHSELPTVEISTDCPSGDNVIQGYIKYETVAICKCDRTNADSSAGSVEWFAPDGSKVGNNSVSNDSSTLQINTTDVSPKNYTCRGVSSEGQTEPGINYAPQIAYGPMAVEVTSDKSIFNLCSNDKNQILSITCSTPMSNTYPIPLLRVHFQEVGVAEDIFTQHGDKDITDGFYRAIFSFRPKTPGSLQIKCRAFNSIFEDLDAVTSLGTPVTVKGPPSSPPSIIVNGKSYNQPAIAQVPESTEDLNVRCVVTGGYPAVSNVTLFCGSRRKTSVDTSVDLEFPVGRDLTGMYCVCLASHETGCYDLQTNITLDIIYQPVVTSFSANNVSTTLEVNRGDSVTFKCSVDGNPTPTLSLERERANFNAKIIVEGNSLERSLTNVHCEDTEVYYCKAENGVDSGGKTSAQKSLKVFVLCPPQLQDPDTQNKKFEVSVGNSITVTVEVLAYPAVYTYELGQYLPHNGVIKMLNTSRYSVSYTEGSAPYGTVALTVLHVTKDDYMEYYFSIENTRDKLEYKFELAQESDSGVDAVAIGVGVGVAVLLLIIIVIIVAVLCRRRSMKKSRSDSLGGFVTFKNSISGSSTNPGFDPRDIYNHTSGAPPSESSYATAFHNMNGRYVANGSEGQARTEDGMSDTDYLDLDDQYDFIPGDYGQTPVEPVKKNQTP